MTMHMGDDIDILCVCVTCIVHVCEDLRYVCTESVFFISATMSCAHV